MLKILELKDWYSTSRLSSLYKKSIYANKEGFRQDIDNQMPILEFARSLSLGGGAFLGGFIDGELVGILGLEPREWGYELCKFHVDAAFMGRGYGRALLEHALRYDAKRFSLHVSISQKRAISLYLSCGFEVSRQEDCKVLIGDRVVVYPTLFMQKERV